MTSDDPSITSYEISGSDSGSRLWLDPRSQFLIGQFPPFPFSALVGSFEEADSSGIFQVTRNHVPWFNYSVPV